jgi:hypothetical protein
VYQVRKLCSCLYRHICQQHEQLIMIMKMSITLPAAASSSWDGYTLDTNHMMFHFLLFL